MEKYIIRKCRQKDRNQASIIQRMNFRLENNLQQYKKYMNVHLH